jgi:hypothetical protein
MSLQFKLGEVAQAQGWILRQIEYLVEKNPNDPYLLELQTRMASLDVAIDALLQEITDLRFKIERAKAELS